VLLSKINHCAPPRPTMVIFAEFDEKIKQQSKKISTIEYLKLNISKIDKDCII